MFKKRRLPGFWPYVIVAVLAAALGVVGSQLFNRMTTPTVHLDTTTVAEQLERSQELATARLSYRGLVRYEEGEIDLINKKAFTMVYDASVTAGVDLSKAKVSVSGRDVSVELPAAEVQGIEIDPDSLQFYDEKFALFNWQNRTDTAKALQVAQDDAEAKVDESKLVKTAADQAKETVETMLAPFTGEGGYTVRVTVAS